MHPRRRDGAAGAGHAHEGHGRDLGVGGPGLGARAEIVGGGGRGAGGGAAGAGRVRDGRDRTQLEAEGAWAGPNTNQLVEKTGKEFKRKGIFLKLDPKEFKEIVLKKSYVVQNEEINSKNRKLVKMYNEIKDHRLYSFLMIQKNLVPKHMLEKLKTAYADKMDLVKGLMEEIYMLNGTPVPLPPHFKDQEVIFGVSK